MNHPSLNPPTRLAAAAAVAAALAALLTGCGIRDTALPVDAGQGASRTACPPAPGVSLSKLDRDAYASPGADQPTTAAEAAESAASSAAATPAAALPCLEPGAAAGPTQTATPTPTRASVTGAPSASPPR